MNDSPPYHRYPQLVDFPALRQQKARGPLEIDFTTTFNPLDVVEKSMLAQESRVIGLLEAMFKAERVNRDTKDQVATQYQRVGAPPARLTGATHLQAPAGARSEVSDD